MSLNPDDVVALIDSYDASQAVGNVRQAQRRLSKALEVAPGDFRALKRLADTRCRMRLVSGEEGKQTKQMIGSVLQLAPDAADARELLAYYHLFRGESANGVGVLERFTEEHPNHPRGWYSYGRFLFHTGEYQRAAEAILKAYRLYPQDCEIYRALCEILPAAGMTSSPTPLDPPQPTAQFHSHQKREFCRGSAPVPTPHPDDSHQKREFGRGSAPVPTPDPDDSIGRSDQEGRHGGTAPTDNETALGDLGRSNREVTLASIVEEMLDRFPQRWSVWATAGRVLVESFQEIERGCSIS
ncbi:tetratricopeptide repeat protein, partial [Microcoleus sp. D2_18a_D3]|uniref:tetratricopeptide repeat protein n=1 Tax=Microcoleus sp. D2_18a_D3 TaxID=3055330 RepID=UPI002FD2FCB4